MIKPTIIIDIINENAFKHLPSLDDITNWFQLVLADQEVPTASLSITYLSLDEMQQLNNQYRYKNKPTNILSFPFEAPPGLPESATEHFFLGDLVISPDVLQQEADEQNKLLTHHQTHIYIHGLLHLLGYDHIEKHDQVVMEALEIKLLDKLTIPNPYDPESING
ncbi:rRNA maturation RNase YbeY [Thiotrichales bacterium 19S11-10]|nr:rRNA maturation RNase YbeY [Thiotrichales bacterium 19S11-10]